VNETQSIAIGRLEATFSEVDLPIGLRVDSVRVTGSSLEVFKDPLRATVPAPGKVEIVISEQSVTEMLSKASPAGLKNMRVRFTEGKMRFDAVKTVLVDLKVSGVCQLHIVDESNVFVQLESVEVMGADIRQLVQSQIEKINPILQTSMFPFPVSLRKIEMNDGRLSVWGEVSPPA
jgi:hypothetical protein